MNTFPCIFCGGYGITLESERILPNNNTRKPGDYSNPDCRHCEGFGQIEDPNNKLHYSLCEFCNGTGEEYCQKCFGRGYISKHLCTSCNGTGLTTDGKEKLPAPVDCQYCGGIGTLDYSSKFILKDYEGRPFFWQRYESKETLEALHSGNLDQAIEILTKFYKYESDWLPINNLKFILNCKGKSGFKSWIDEIRRLNYHGSYINPGFGIDLEDFCPDVNDLRFFWETIVDSWIELFKSENQKLFYSSFYGHLDRFFYLRINNFYKLFDLVWLDENSHHPLNNHLIAKYYLNKQRLSIYTDYLLESAEKKEYLYNSRDDYKVFFITREYDKFGKFFFAYLSINEYTMKECFNEKKWFEVIKTAANISKNPDALIKYIKLRNIHDDTEKELLLDTAEIYKTMGELSKAEEILRNILKS